MNGDASSWRADLARELTKRSKATAGQMMSVPLAGRGDVPRTGITGPPGAGKSSLIAMLAAQWLSSGAKVGVLAVDPSSPSTGGSVLGDRARMDAVADNPNLFIRSFSSGQSVDGLAPNMMSLLDCFEQAGFDEIVLETVGVGQVSYEVRKLVETLVLVLVPESGDVVQAMKAGILETADIYVINKSDLPGSNRLASEIGSLVSWRKKKESWTPPIVRTSSPSLQGAAELADSIARHRQSDEFHRRQQELLAGRHSYHLRSIILRRLAEVLSIRPVDPTHRDTVQAYREVIEAMATTGA